ncbi:hypothetical protein [Candidatus Palauibacter sp.]|uniref:hypothetical protein n=1 Tax=Candidatus Palauibacter sp. TaxID=3101350 RepID=UPI003B524BFF
MISHRYRCINIKVPRCGSTSLRDWFLDHGSGRHSFKPRWYGGLLPDRIQSVTRLMNLYPDYATFTFVPRSVRALRVAVPRPPNTA